MILIFKGYMLNWMASARTSNIFRGALSAFIIQGAGFGLKYLNLILLARWMGSIDFGIYAYVLSWIQILSVVAGLGLSAGVIRFVPEYLIQSAWGRLSALVRRTRQLTLITGIFLAILGSWIVFAFRSSGMETQTMLIGMWMIPLLALSNLNTELIRGTERIIRAYIPNIVIHPFLIAVVALFVFSISGHLSSLAGIVITAGSYLTVLVIQAYLLGKTLPSFVSSARPEPQVRHWLKVALPLLLSSSALMLIAQADIVLVGALINSEAAGIYAAARRSAIMVGFALIATNSIVAPRIAALYTSREMGKLQQLVKKVSLAGLVIAGGMGVILIIIGRLVLNLFGSNFDAAYTSLVILAIGEVINASAGPSGFLLTLTGNERASVWIYAISAFLHVILNLALIPWLGIIGAAVATCTVTVIWNLWLSVLIHNKLGIRSFMFLLLPILNTNPPAKNA